MGWQDEFQHESLEAPEAREAFTKAMGKYETPDAAIVGGFNAIKEVGKPFKLPESFDKLPDDKARGELRTGIGKLIGAVEKPEDLKDVNWLLDSTLEDDKPDEELVKAITAFAVSEKAPKGLIQKLASFWNKMQGGNRTKQGEIQKQQQAQLEAKIKEVNEKLTADAGDDEKLKVDLELTRRMFQNNAGLTADEYAEIADVMFDKGLISSYAFNKALINLAKNYKSGSTDAGTGTHPSPDKSKTATIEQTYPKTGKALGWTQGAAK